MQKYKGNAERLVTPEIPHPTNVQTPANMVGRQLGRFTRSNYLICLTMALCHPESVRDKRRC